MLSDEEYEEVVKNVVLYHLVPDAIVYSGQVANNRALLNTNFVDVDILEAVCTILVSQIEGCNTGLCIFSTIRLHIVVMHESQILLYFYEVNVYI